MFISSSMTNMALLFVPAVAYDRLTSGSFIGEGEFRRVFAVDAVIWAKPALARLDYCTFESLNNARTRPSLGAGIKFLTSALRT